MVARLYEDVDCNIAGCTRPAYVRGWCENHYSRWKRYGSPLAGGPDRPVRPVADARRRLAAAMDQLEDPVGLAKKYLGSRRLLGGRDQDDLLDTAIDAIVDAAISWEPNGGRSLLSWAWLYMERNVQRELAACYRRRAELAIDVEAAERATWRNDHGVEEMRRVELRTDLQRWADLARLTPLMRFLVSYSALYAGTYVRDTPLAAAGPTPLHGPGAGTLKVALGHMRRAAVSNEPRDDRWTRASDAGRAGRLAKSNALLEQLRAVEADRDRAAETTRHGWSGA